ELHEPFRPPAPLTRHGDGCPARHTARQGGTDPEELNVPVCNTAAMSTRFRTGHSKRPAAMISPLPAHPPFARQLITQGWSDLEGQFRSCRQYIPDHKLRDVGEGRADSDRG